MPLNDLHTANFAKCFVVASLNNHAPEISKAGRGFAEAIDHYLELHIQGVWPEIKAETSS